MGTHWLAKILLFAAVAAQGQPMAVQTGSPPMAASSPGRLVGTVQLADTNTPARMARVRLEPVPTEGEGENVRGGAGSSAETLLDGSFALENIRPGAYFVIVEKEGYVSRRALVTAAELGDPTPAVQQRLSRLLSRVQIDSGSTARVDLRLERGAAIGGTVRFDDGSPAAGLPVDVLRKNADGKWVDVRISTSFARPAATDDRGMFRIAALPPDTYLLRTTLGFSGVSMGGRGPLRQGGQPGGAGWARIQFFGSGTATIRDTDASGFSLGAGQEIVGEDVVIPVSKLHTVSGRVAVADAAHTVNAGAVTLTGTDGQVLERTSISNDDGIFLFPFVAEGQYVVKVSGAADMERANTSYGREGRMALHIVAQYGDGELPLDVRGDRNDVVVSVRPSVPASGVAATGSRQ